MSDNDSQVLLTTQQVEEWEAEEEQLTAEIAAARKRLKRVRKKLAAVAMLVDLGDTEATRSEMPIGPNGEKRPVSTVQCAHKVVMIATGQQEEEYDPKLLREGSQRLGHKGGTARAKKLSAKRRREIAQRAAEARWGKASETGT